MRRLIRIEQLRKMLGHSNATIYRLIKKADLPSPIKLTTRTSAWDEEEIERWISKKLQPQNVAITCMSTVGDDQLNRQPDSPTEAPRNREAKS